MNTEPPQVDDGSESYQGYDEPIGSALFLVLLCALSALVLVVVAVAHGRALA